MILFLFLDENIHCGYLLEVPQLGASNEYPQYMFTSRNKKIIDTFRMKKAPYLELRILVWAVLALLSIIGCLTKE